MNFIPTEYKTFGDRGPFKADKKEDSNFILDTYVRDKEGKKIALVAGRKAAQIVTTSLNVYFGFEQQD